MADPQLIESLPPGVKWAPGVMDDVPSDFAVQYTAGTPYVAVVAPSDADPSIPKLVYVVGSGVSGGGGGGFVPTYIAPGETFTVPADRQALFRRTIINEGSLVVLGTLIQV